MRGAAVARRAAMLWTCPLPPVAHEFVRMSSAMSRGSLAAPVSPEWPMAITPVAGPDDVDVARAGDSCAAGEPPPLHATAVSAATAAIVVAVRPRVAPTSSPCGVDARIIQPIGDRRRPAELG